MNSNLKYSFFLGRHRNYIIYFKKSEKNSEILRADTISVWKKKGVSSALEYLLDTIWILWNVKTWTPLSMPAGSTSFIPGHIWFWILKEGFQRVCKFLIELKWEVRYHQGNRANLNIFRTINRSVWVFFLNQFSKQEKCLWYRGTFKLCVKQEIWKSKKKRR